MRQSKNFTVIKFALCSALLSFAALAHAAETIGTVLLLSGPLLVKKADGKSRILARNSVLSEGDTLATRKDSYAKLHFSDDSEIILQPETTLRIEKFSFDASQPQQDQARFALVSGGLQVTAGLLGKRSPERAILMTPQGEVNIGGATAIIEYREADVAAQAMLRSFLFASTAVLDIADAAVRTDAPALSVSAPLLLAQLLIPSPTATRAPGLYVQVLDGLIHVTNPAGTSNFSAGQFGFTPSVKTPPVMLPVNPGMQFTPPPAFSAPTSAVGSGGTTPGMVDCVVR
ncbi:FecR family protein [Herbaspirillum autotrophicum]|uniref:FecR family protein n=1 Tax=Herbaspirillum autotrophicum TaxID=180195 RepID=UPI00067C5293|nr:FecR domain-containing protein [Herbaspirillum autotrophicum]